MGLPACLPAGATEPLNIDSISVLYFFFQLTYKKRPANKVEDTREKYKK
jgi:hypothetical protein